MADTTEHIAIAPYYQAADVVGLGSTLVVGARYTKSQTQTSF